MSLQYYVATRVAAFLSLLPVAGNLAHHAVELAAKAQLSDRISEAVLKKEYGHKLFPKLWHAYEAVAGVGLERFDGLVAGIHSWEGVRYMPSAFSSVVTSVATPTWMGSENQRAMSSVEPAPAYTLDLSELDELMSEMYCRMGLEVNANLNAEARTWLLRDNRYFE